MTKNGVKKIFFYLNKSHSLGFYTESKEMRRNVHRKTGCKRQAKDGRIV